MNFCGALNSQDNAYHNVIFDKKKHISQN